MIFEKLTETSPSLQIGDNCHIDFEAFGVEQGYEHFTHGFLHPAIVVEVCASHEDFNYGVRTIFCNEELLVYSQELFIRLCSLDDIKGLEDV